MRTFEQVLNDGYQYPEIVPESLQGVIYDWFRKREVCDDDNFERFFNRVIYRDYHRYNELLRIEAGTGLEMTAGFDWLVNSYMEREHITDISGNVVKNGTVTMEGTVSDEFEPGVVIEQETVGEDKFGKTETFEHGLKSETTYGRRDQRDIESDNVSGNATSGNATNTSKATPASIIGTYGNGTESSAEIGGGGAGIDTELGDTECWDAELSAPTAISKTVNNQIVQNAEVGTSQDISQASGKDTTQNSGNDITTHGGKDEISRTVTTTKTGTDENIKTYDTLETTGGREENTSKNTVHEIYTGRNGENMASALEKAKHYIQSTSAWDWLQHQLEPCFLGIYSV